MPEYSFASPRQGRPLVGARGLYAEAIFTELPLPLDIHLHSEVEVGLVLAGEERIEFSDHQLTCRPGDVWLCGTREPHGFAKSAGTRNLVLLFAPEFIGEELVGEVPWLTLFSVPPAQRPQVTSPEMRRRVLAIGQVLRGEIEQARPNWQSAVRLELLRLLIELHRGWDLSRLPRTPGPVRLSSLARLMPALNLVHSLPWRRVEVTEAAAACRLSGSRFQDLFRHTMGVSFGAFGLRARLSYATHRLLNTDRSVAAIAAEAGFVDDSHLHRVFVKQYACTPAQYRERRKAAVEA